MKKEIIKKIAALGLVGSMLIPTMVFADDTTAITNVQADNTVKERPVRNGLRGDIANRIENGDRPENPNGSMGKGGQIRDIFGDRTLEIVTLYAPELLSDFETALDSQEAIRESMKALQSTERDTHQAAYQALLTTIKADLESGVITKDEAQSQFDAFRTSGQADRDALKTDLEALQSTYGIEPKENMTLMTTLKTAIDNKDEAAIHTALTALLAQINQHLQYDQAVYNLFLAQ